MGSISVAMDSQHLQAEEKSLYFTRPELDRHDRIHLYNSNFDEPVIIAKDTLL